MDPTTLVAFLFKAPPEARTVELLGSWDNFTHAYRMEHDRRRGTGFWSGCFKFENIIFDGDSSNWNKPRTGGLKQGGTYWYYYRLNDDDEAYDDSKPYTTTCPLLPGQPVNVIEVPVEVQDAPPRARSASMDVAVTVGHLPNTQTLNPRDKFNPLNPPPISKVHGRCLSDYALGGRLESQAQAFRSVESIPSPPQSSAHESSRYEDDGSIPPTDQPPQGYYADDTFAHDTYYADSRTSFNSQRSWHSSAPTFSHSSGYDEYDSHTNPFDLTPVPELPSSRDRLGTGVSYVEDTPFDFGFYENSSGSWVEDVEPWVLEDNTNPPFNPSFSATGDHYAASRPTTSHGQTQWLPLHRWSTQDLHNAGHFGDEWKLPDDITTEEADEGDPNGEQDVFDVLSPSFSAATISSVGVNTPFRLSVAASGTASAYDANHNNDSSLQQVAERLRSLSAGDLHERTRFYRAEDAALSTYTLPNPETAPFEGMRSADKLSSADTGIVFDLPLPSLMQQTTTSSLEDDIFSALSF
jgi:hypothetical protein